jgi:hypothetical protein
MIDRKLPGGLTLEPLKGWLIEEKLPGGLVLEPLQGGLVEEKILDIYEFDDLIDAYQTAQNEGTTKDRADARRSLKDAYRAALRAAGRSDR